MKISNPCKSCNFDVNSNSSEYTKQTGEMLLFTLMEFQQSALVSLCTKIVCFALTLQIPDQICNFSYSQPYNSYNVSSENLVLDQLIIP